LSLAHVVDKVEEIALGIILLSIATVVLTASVVAVTHLLKLL
jgi:hypothetical protein